MMQQVVTGVILGLGYGLAASGLALIFGVMRVINFAQGEFYMLGALGLLIFATFGLPTWAAILLAVAAVGLLGALLFRWLILDVVDDEIAGLMITYGISLLVVSLVLEFRGATPEPLPRLAEGVFRFGGNAVPMLLTIAGAVAVAAILGLHSFLTRSGMGLMIRAAASNRMGAEVSGVPFARTQIVTFGLGAALAGLAGALLGPQAFFTSEMGAPILAKSFAVVVLGGLGSARGAFVAGIALGVLEALAVGYAPGGWQGLVAYILLIASILIAFSRVEFARWWRRRGIGRVAAKVSA